jgi:hypothetical protein
MSQNRTGVDAAVGNWPDVLDVAVAECVQVVRAGSGSDWSVRAGRLDWTCRATALHIASDLVGYTGRLTAPRERGYVPFEVVFEEEPDAEGMAEAIRSTGGLLSAAARTAAPGVLSWHPFGMAGPVDLCAMGVVEGLVHAHDIAEGLGIQWQAPGALAARPLEHLFGQAREPGDAWRELLVATGRVPGPDGIHATSWRWHNTGM